MTVSLQTEQVAHTFEGVKLGTTQKQVEHSTIFIDSLEEKLNVEAQNLQNVDTIQLEEQKVDNNNIPAWVDTDYFYDPSNPRKPNMREFLEAFTKSTVEDLYANETSNWQQTTSLASQVLYTVVGSGADNRDWDNIMNSENILDAANEATAKLLQPSISIMSITDHTGNLTKQTATINDQNGKILRSLSGNTDHIYQTLSNFGVTSSSIPKNIATQVNTKFFSQEILEILLDYRASFEKQPANKDINKLISS